MDFREARREYERLRIEHQAGRLSAQDFQSAIDRLIVNDRLGNQWQIGVSTGAWYRREGQQWVRDIPPEDAVPPPPPPAAQFPPPPPPVMRPPSPAGQPQPYTPVQRPPAPAPAPYVPAGQPPPPPPMAPPATPMLSNSRPARKRRSGWLVGCVVLVLVLVCLAALAIGANILAPGLVENVTGLLGNQGTIWVQNTTDMTVCYLYISPSDNDDWGEDWLEGDTINPGDTQTFRVELNQTVDIAALDCNQQLLHQVFDVAVTSMGVTYTLTPLP